MTTKRQIETESGIKLLLDNVMIAVGGFGLCGINRIVQAVDRAKDIEQRTTRPRITEKVPA